jgi:L-alanine-DL-glutamate epimerase-like enolase superfamily enzyme
MLDEPVYKLLGYKKAYPKLPYASQLFGKTPEETFTKAKKASKEGYKAVKFGWGTFGKISLQEDIAHLEASREGMGEEAYLMIDAGTAWGVDVSAAKKRLRSLKKINAYWLEEPFINGALEPYKQLSESTPCVPMAGGEGCNNFVQAQAMINHAGLKFIQVDAGRIGGITIAKEVADLAKRSNVTYVNHTFTSHLALSASLQAYAGIEKDFISEYPIELSTLAREISQTEILPNVNGFIQVPEGPGLGILVDTTTIKKYLVAVEIKVNGKNIYYTPQL